MKIETCCFTGHRKLAVDQRNEIALKLEKAVMSLIWSGYRHFGAGPGI